MDDLGTIKDKLDTIIDLLTEIKNGQNVTVNNYSPKYKPQCQCHLKNHSSGFVPCLRHDLPGNSYNVEYNYSSVE